MWCLLWWHNRLCFGVVVPMFCIQKVQFKSTPVRHTHLKQHVLLQPSNITQYKAVAYVPIKDFYICPLKRFKGMQISFFPCTFFRHIPKSHHIPILTSAGTAGCIELFSSGNQNTTRGRTLPVSKNGNKCQQFIQPWKINCLIYFWHVEFGLSLPLWLKRPTIRAYKQLFRLLEPCAMDVKSGGY